MMPISKELIEELNARGPYTHGIWRNDDFEIGNEEQLSGRASFLAETLRTKLTNEFSAQQLSQMSLLDVGCYDGWLLCQIEDLPLRRLVGVEARAKNLEKGAFVRSSLGLKSRCEFLPGTIENLSESVKGEQFDIVVSTGLLHHLESISFGLSQLRSVCRNRLFLETICLPSVFETAELEKELELKDITYFHGPKLFGLTAHKLESSYYDGSAASLGVVSIPSVQALKMMLTAKGFQEVETAVSIEEYRRRVRIGARNCNLACLWASANPRFEDSTVELARSYETGVVTTLLPGPWIAFLWKCLNHQTSPAPIEHLYEVVFGDPEQRQIAWQAFSSQMHDEYLQEIIRNLYHNARDKITLEWGKRLVADRQFSSAVPVLQSLTQRNNADWRSVFRACCLLSWAFAQLDDHSNARRYRNLCSTANPLFPSDLLSSSASCLHEAEISLREELT